MRKVTPLQILIFQIPLLASIFGGIFISYSIMSRLPLGAYEPIATVTGSLFFIVILSIIFYRACLLLFPIPTGEIGIKSKEEFAYHIHLLFHMVFFHSLIRPQVIPVPLLKFIFIALGAKIGTNSYSSGLILDNIFVTIGENTLIGHAATLIPHALENEKLGHYPIVIGSNVTIGAGSMILPGVTIDDHALVSANAVVIKGTHIHQGEIWGGVPAKKISHNEYYLTDTNQPTRIIANS